MNVRVVSILLFLFGSFFLEGQDKTDSLLNVLKTERTDTTRILLLNDLAKEFRNFNPDTAIIISKDALKSALSLKYTKGIAVSAHNTGAEYYMEGNYNEALRYFNYALPAWKLVYPPDGGIKKATSLGNMGLVFTEMGNFPKALDCFLHVLETGEKYHDEQLMANTYANLGLVYFNQKNYKNALDYYLKAEKANSTLSGSEDTKIAKASKKRLAVTSGNIGNVYYEQGELSKALGYYKKSLTLREELKLKNLIASTLGNIGVIYSDLARKPGVSVKMKDSLLDASLDHFSRALQITELINDQNGNATNLVNLGNLSIDKMDLAQTQYFLSKGLAEALKIDAKPIIKTAYYSLSRLDSIRGDNKANLEHYKLYIQYNDSLANEENTKKTVQAEMQYEFDKKEAATKLETEKKEAIAMAESKRQRMILWAVSGFGVLILGFALFAYRSFLQKRKANIEITKQKEIIEEKQKEIVDSIYYARRIQRSLLTSEFYIDRELRKHRGL